MEKGEPSCTTGGNVNWYYGEQYESVHARSVPSVMFDSSQHYEL